ncbi:hypothetical protein BDB01DRAFT_847654 [Pilobolus umbonatus]|nr:hypothetical protein BDB01DRAFT_847654 [Pilobolus umbonatus]
MTSSPLHPGRPQWQTYEQWVKPKQPKAIEITRTEEKTREYLLKKFNLKEEDNGWGNEAQPKECMTEQSHRSFTAFDMCLS